MGPVCSSSSELLLYYHLRLNDAHLLHVFVVVVIYLHVKGIHTSFISNAFPTIQY